MIKFYCPSCNQKLGVPDDYAGRRIRCNKCSTPSIVPKSETSIVPQEVKSQSVTATGVPAAAQSASAKIELEPSLNFESSDIPPMDPNAELLRQISRARADSINSTAMNTKSESPPSFERFGVFSKILNPLISIFGSFPLAVLSSAVCAAIVIVIWNCISAAVGFPLEVFYIAVALAAGLGLCVISEQRSASMGLLALFMAIIAIIAARIVQVERFVFPEWRSLVAAVDIPPEREQLYLMLNSFGSKQMRQAHRAAIAEDNTEMMQIAICALIQDKQISPSQGADLSRKARSQMERISHPYDPNSDNITFDEPALSEIWSKVNEKFGEWNSPEKRVAAAGTYQIRQIFFIEQCRYKTLLDDYPKAVTAGFFVVDGCIFLFLRVTYCLVGLIGAYKTCSTSFMD